MPHWPAPPSLRLSMAVPSSFPHDPPLSSPSPHLQFELLPLRPTAHRPVPSSSSPSASPPPRPSSPPHPWPSLFSAQTPRGGIDVNQIPSSPVTSEEAVADFADLQEADPCGRVDTAVGSKRAREKSSEMDQDRTCEVSSRAGSDEDEGASTRKKLRLSKEQSALLEESFKEHSTLNPKQKNALAKQLSLRPRQVEVWFQNRRARTKLKQTEVDCELLKRCCQSLTEENRRLQKELKELRAIKVAAPCVFAHDFYMPLPATTLTMCPSCERLAAMDNRSRGFTKAQLPQYQQPSAAC